MLCYVIYSYSFLFSSYFMFTEIPKQPRMRSQKNRCQPSRIRSSSSCGKFSCFNSTTQLPGLLPSLNTKVTLLSNPAGHSRIRQDSTNRLGGSTVSTLPCTIPSSSEKGCPTTGENVQAERKYPRNLPSSEKKRKTSPLGADSSTVICRQLEEEVVFFF